MGKEVLNRAHKKNSFSMAWVRSSSSASRHLRRVEDSYNTWASQGDILKRGRKAKEEAAMGIFITYH
jgi:hypothetical protein